MKVDTYQCEICGVQKAAANHWWKVYPVLGGLIILEWDAELVNGIHPTETPAHLCGESHTLEWVSKRLTKAS